MAVICGDPPSLAMASGRLEVGEAPHLLSEPGGLVPRPGDLGRERLGGLLAVGGVELLQVARDARLDLGSAFPRARFEVDASFDPNRLGRQRSGRPVGSGLWRA
jgi:hypothetical protein